MTVLLQPSWTALTIAYLKATTEVTSSALGTRISTSFKANQVFPAAQVQFLDGFSKRPTIEDGVVQIDVYGRIPEDPGAPGNVDFDSEADTLARLIRWAMEHAHETYHSRAVVTNAYTRRLPMPLPDTIYTPARPRWSADYRLTGHPHPL